MDLKTLDLTTLVKLYSLAVKYAPILAALIKEAIDAFAQPHAPAQPASSGPVGQDGFVGVCSDPDGSPDSEEEHDDLEYEEYEELFEAINELLAQSLVVNVRFVDLLFGKDQEQ